MASGHYWKGTNKIGNTKQKTNKKIQTNKKKWAYECVLLCESEFSVSEKPSQL